MKLKKAAFIILVLLVLLVAGYFLFRNTFLESALEKVKNKFASRHYTLTIAESGFQGFATVIANDIVLVPENGDTLLSFKKARATLSFIQFISGNYPVNELLIENGFVHIIENSDSLNNYSALLSSEEVNDSIPQKESGNGEFKKMFNSAWSNVARLSGLNLLVKDFEFLWRSPNYSEQLLLENFSIKNSLFVFNASVNSEGISNSIDMIGTIDPSSGVIEFQGESTEKKITYFPFLKKITGVNLFAEKFGGNLTIVDESANEIELIISAAAARPGLNHWRIGPDDVLLDSIGMNLNIKITPENILIEAPSHFMVNRLPMSVEAGYTKSDQTLIKLKAGFENVESDNLFNSLPHGLFNSVEGIKTSGKLTYNLHLEVDIDNPDSLVFESSMKKDHFKILAYGKENFASINNDFIYEARENDRVVRLVNVSPSDPYFTPLSNISLVLIGSVLTAEDGTFMFHKGFNEEAFRKSMATNIRERRFARGGSTITMQLVKNVFLSRNKTISRKVEEALIVWLIENQRIVTKERMLEVYLNIIEWGPGVYGIGEAADFYFAKKPMQLTLDESIFLSSIIPRPKYFKYSFQPDGTLRSYLKNYYDVVSGRLLKKQIIGQPEVDNMKYQVELKGRALNIVVPVDTTAIDSIYIDNAGEIYN